MTFQRFAANAAAFASMPARTLLLAIIVVTPAITVVGAPEQPVSPVDGVRQTVTEWAKTRAETVRVEANWQSEHELLVSTLKAERERAQALADQKKILDSKMAGARETLGTLAAENGAATTALNAAADRLRQLSADLTALRPQLPPRLSAALELPYRSLANPALGPGERMQFVTTILNRCTQFNKTIAYGEEALALPGEDSRRVFEVIYWGVSHGYALDRAGHKAYFGSAGAQGWTWEAAPDSATSVGQLIDIYRDKADPSFVEVPARVSVALPN